MRYFHTFTAFSITVIALVLLFPLGVLFFLLYIAGLRRLSNSIVRVIAQSWARLVIWGTGCRMTVEGTENIPKKTGLCIVSNHGSIFDIVVHLAYSGRVVGFIAKRELAVIPFLNLWILLLGGFFIDRKNPRQALKTFAHGIKRIKEGSVILIFPEGHRSRGQGLLPFKAGSFKLAADAEALIVPAAIQGSYEVFEKTGFVTACPVRVAYGKPFSPAEISGGRAALAEYTKARIEELCKG